MPWQAGVIEPLGWVRVEMDSKQRIVALMLPALDARSRAVPDDEETLSPRIADALRGYVEGSDQVLRSLPITAAATPFIELVRQELCAIPFGSVTTYGEVAKRIGKPGAARAIGRVCATNKVLLIVPCHRVLAAKGQGGFALGPVAKDTLLTMERAALAGMHQSRSR